MRSAVPVFCPRCGDLALVSRSRPEWLDGCLLFLAGVLLAPFALGVLLIVEGANKMARQRLSGRCPRCRARLER